MSSAATTTVNRQWRLRSRPVGMPKREDFELREEAVPEPADGQLLVRVEYISLDPAMRGWMREGRSYVPPVRLGEVMRAYGAGRVLVSRNPDYAEGTYVAGLFGVQELALSDGRGLTPVDPGLAPLPVHLGLLGMPGLTAYFGLLDVGRPEPGQTVVVSAAAGAVGGVVGQLAKIKGCRAVGIAGGAEKCRHVVEDLGFDAAIDYKSEDVGAALREHCPDGVHVYFDNVGGEILDAVLPRIARGARIVICGAVSQYNAEGPGRGPSNYMMLLVERASMTGFLVMDYAARAGEAVAEMATWMKEGRLRSQEDVVRGLDTFPETLLRLFTGANLGKLVLEVDRG